MKYKLVIFDLDGTIADTSPGILNSIKYTQEKMNLPEISLEQMYSHIGPPMSESYNRNFGLTGEKLNQAISYHKEYAMKQGYKEIKLYDGIVDLLENLRRKGVITAVATLKAQSTTVKIFEHLELTDKFNIIRGVEAINPKTKAQLLKECIEEANIKIDTGLPHHLSMASNDDSENLIIQNSAIIKKSECVLIGDSKYDAIGAEQAGIDFIAVTYGFGYKTKGEADKFHNVGVSHTIKEIHQLLITK